MLEYQHARALEIMNPLLRTYASPARLTLSKKLKVEGCIDFDTRGEDIKMSIKLNNNLIGMNSFYALQVTNLHETGHYTHFTANPEHLRRYLDMNKELRKQEKSDEGKREEMLGFRALNELIAEFYAVCSLNEMGELEKYSSIKSDKVIPTLAKGILSLRPSRSDQLSLLRRLMFEPYEQAVANFGRDGFAVVKKRYIEEVNYERNIIKYLIENIRDIGTEAAAKTQQI